MAEKPTYEELEQRVKELEVEFAGLKQAEEAIFGSEKSLRCLFDSSAFGMIVCRLIRDKAGKSVDFEHLEVNPETQRHTGFKHEQLIGKRASEIVSAEVTAHLVQIYSKVVETGKPHRYEEYFSAYDRTLQVGASHIEDDLFALTFVDISERKQAEESLRNSERRLKLAQESAGAGVWDWDFDSERLNFSRELFILFGLDPDKTEPTFDIWDQVLHPDDKKMVHSRIEKAIKQGTPHDTDYRIVLPDGHVRWIKALGNTIYDQDKQPVRMAGICIDITERKQAEDALQASEAQKKAILDGITINLAFVNKDLKFLRAVRVELSRQLKI